MLSLKMENDQHGLLFLCEFLGLCKSAVWVCILGCGSASPCNCNCPVTQCQVPVTQCRVLEEWGWYFLLWIASCWLAVIFIVFSKLWVIFLSSNCHFYSKL